MRKYPKNSPHRRLDRQAKIDKLTLELTMLKRWKFGRSSEQLSGT